MRFRSRERLTTSNPTESNAKTEQKKLLRVFLLVMIGLTVCFLGIGAAFYSARRDDFNKATIFHIKHVVQSVQSKLAMEIFLNQTGAYKPRLHEIESKLGELLRQPGVCLVNKSNGAVFSTFTGCNQVALESRNYFAAGNESFVGLDVIEGDKALGRVLVKYEDPFNLATFISDYRWHLLLIASSFVAIGLILMLAMRTYMRAVFERVTAAERMDATGKMAQMLAHDIRRPLSLLLHSLDLISRSRNPETVKRVAINSLPQARKAQMEIETMLSDIRDSATDIELARDPVSAQSIISEILSDLGQVHPVLDVKLSYAFCHTGLLDVDRRQVKRALANIIANAIDAMNGEGRLWFESNDCVDRHGNQFIQITLGNSGSFIAPEDRERIFDIYFTRGKEKGTGIGLAIAKKVIMAHGGRVWCKSSATRGTEFVLTLPGLMSQMPEEHALPDYLLQGKAEVASEVARVPVFADSSDQMRKTVKMLLVDDDDDFHSAVDDLVHIISTEQDSSVKIVQLRAKTPTQALKISALERPELIILDVDLGRGVPNGIDVLKNLRRSGCEAVICVNTNGATPKIQNHALRSGADAFIPKPLSVESLEQLIGQAMV